MSAVAEQFGNTGYVVVRNLLSADEVATYRHRLQELSGLRDCDWQRAWSCPDGVSRNRDFWPLIFHDRLLQVVREILGPSARYTQHSDLHVHRVGAGWHRDSAHRSYGTGADWDETKEPYRVVRVAIYLQSYAESGSELGLVPRSHQYEHRLRKREREVWGRLFAGWHRVERLLASREKAPRMKPPGDIWVRTGVLGKWSLKPPSQPVWVATEPGDCILFDTRVLHVSTGIRGPKYAIFLSYGADNRHSRNHRRYYLRHRRDLGYREFDPELAQRLADAGLLLEVEEGAELRA